jgi:hypothetical protein
MGFAHFIHFVCFVFLSSLPTFIALNTRLKIVIISGESVALAESTGILLGVTAISRAVRTILTQIPMLDLFFLDYLILRSFWLLSCVSILNCLLELFVHKRG